MPEKITIRDGNLSVPDNPIICLLKGDGTGPEIVDTAVSVIDRAVAKAYDGRRKLHWLELPAGLNSLEAGGELLPAATLAAIRDHVIATGGVLFDFADIESYDPDGDMYYLPLYADDGCNYVLDGQSHNWATEWCAAHPDENSTCSCAHSQSLNCDMKGRVFWWMMARLAARAAGDFDDNNRVDLADLQFLLSSYGQDAGGDLDRDGDTDLEDLQLLLANYGAGCAG